MNQRRLVDLDAWPRRDQFEHFTRFPCTYSLTIRLDVTSFTTAVRQAGRKAYPSQVWAISSLLNRHEEFRMSVDDGIPSVWDVVHPAFTVFNSDRETFSSVWLPHDDDFDAFHAEAVELSRIHRSADRMFPQGELPDNAFDISSLPWVSFTGFELNIAGGHGHYLPIFTLGKYVDEGDRVFIPLAVQLHHAVADGFHVARLINELQELFDSAGEWL
ncbi:CatA-like O-acetyltransferase [Gryllotalpicola protaetiae]|uniref:Chloramphenicol acetyltransferase n=1 Tax=Gryllotalpicola protaetiae TaxID=2419771 RepID=A0A387BQ59_9MICO|nr:CatA-like O-acetyltransferase [Gryllotalpicola protaetiae]AYG04642.1 chloramphenicol acetyltransferase CAT [Gryllotalpicola protaetiae]